MTLPAFATTEALAARLPGGLSEADEPRAQAALDDASALIRAVARKTWVTGDDLDDDIPDVIATVCLTVARRAMTNPDGVSAEGLVSYNVSYADASSDIYLTRNERKLVLNAAGGATIGVLPLSRGFAETTSYVDVVGSDEPLPVDLPGIPGPN